MTQSSRGRPSRRAALLGAAGTVLVCGGPARAQLGGGYPTLPATVVDTRVSDLRGQLQQYLPGTLPPRVGGPAFLIQPSIGIDVGVTDNAQRVDRGRQADVFTTVSPVLQLSGDTSRVTVNLNYSPLLTAYANTPSQTRIDQFGNGVLLLKIVPDAVFLDIRGTITQQSRTGGYGQTSTQTLNRNDQIQSATVSVTPYAEHRFSGWGTGQVGYSFARTVQDGRSNQANFNTNQSDQFGTQNQFFGATGNLTTQRERASFVTGENFGRINDIVVVEAVQYSGVGAYRGAHRNQVTNDVGYAITRKITALAGFGYQDLQFSGTPGIHIKEPIWSVGARFAPDQDSTLTVTYGHRDGFNSFGADGALSPTARTRVFVRYSTGLTTDAQEQQNLLASTNVGPTGLLVDQATGAPVSSSSGSFGTQNGLYRLRRVSVTGSLILNRDAISVSLSNEERTNVSNITSVNGTATVPAGTSSTGTFGTVAWQHDLSPALSSTASVSYGVDDTAAIAGAGANTGSRRTIQASLALNYIFTQTLTGSARYLFTDRSGGVGQNQTNFNSFGFGQSGQSYTENILLVGLRKSF